MTRFSVIILTFSLLAGPALAGGGFLRSVEAAQKEARQKNQLIFVDLFADWCGWCHRFEQEVVPSEKFQNATKDMVLLRVDTEDGKEGTELGRQYGATSLPMFVVLTQGMTVAGIIKGYAPPSQFAEQIEKVKKDYADFQKRLAGEAAIANDFDQRLELAKELYARHSFAESETRLRKLIAEKNVTPSIRDQAYYFLAAVHASQKKFDEAAATLKKFLALQSKGDTVEQGRFLLARIYMDQQKYQAALDEFKKFKTMYPASPLVNTVNYLIPQLESAIARAQ